MFRRRFASKLWIVVLLVFVVVGMSIPGVRVKAKENYLSLGTRPQSYFYKGETVAKAGLSAVGNVIISYKGIVLKFDGYADAYTRICPVDKYTRIIEISNFPRAYKDTNYHTYSRNTNFTVSEADLNYYDEEGKRWYQSTREELVALGSRGTHYTGEPLPGFFPKWIEYSVLQPVMQSNVFTTTFLPGESKIISAILLSGATPSDITDIVSLSSGIKTKSFTLVSGTGYKVLYIHYEHRIGQ